MVAASMPPNTVVPIDWRLAAPAPVANISGTTPRMKAKAVIRIGRRRKPRRLHRGLDDARGLPRAGAWRIRRSGSRSWPRGRSASRSRSANRRRSAMSRSHSASSAPNRASGTASSTMKGIDQLSYCAARMRKTKTMREAEDDARDRARLELLERDAGPFVAEIARQRRRGGALHRGDRLARADSRARRRR